MVKTGSSLPLSVKGQEWDSRLSYTVRRGTYESSPVQSSGLETASQLTGKSPRPAKCPKLLL